MPVLSHMGGSKRRVSQRLDPQKWNFIIRTWNVVLLSKKELMPKVEWGLLEIVGLQEQLSCTPNSGLDFFHFGERLFWVFS